MFPFILLNIVSKPPLYVKSSSFNKKYGTLTEDVFKKRGMFQRSYYVIFVFYRVILTFLLVYMYTSPEIQLALMFTLQISLIAFIMKFRPFRSELQQVVAVTDEMTIVFGLILIYMLYLNQDDVDNSQSMAMLIVGVIVMSLIKNLGLMLLLSIKSSYLKFRAWAHKKLDIEKIERKQRRQMRRERRKQKSGQNKFDEPGSATPITQSPLTPTSSLPVEVNPFRVKYNKMQKIVKEIDKVNYDDHNGENTRRTSGPPITQTDKIKSKKRKPVYIANDSDQVSLKNFINFYRQ